MLVINSVARWSARCWRSGILSQPRWIHISSTNQLVSKQFEDAKSKLATLTEDPGNDVKLKLYALFKQVIEKTNDKNNKNSV
jgi:hypothetical protein